MRCILCYGSDTYARMIHNILCPQCAFGLKLLQGHDYYTAATPEAPGLLTADVPKEDDEDIFRFDVPLLASDRLESLRYAGALNLGVHAMADLVEIWLFADAYAVPELRFLASAALFEALAFNQASVADLANLFEMIYANTRGPETDFELDRKTSSCALRRTSASYLAYHSSKFQECSEFKAILSRNGDLAVDLFIFTTRIREGNVGGRPKSS